MRKLVSIPVRIKDSPYKIYIGNHLLNRSGRLIKENTTERDAIIITHPIIDRKYGAVLRASLIASGFSVKVIHVPASEKTKSETTLLRVMRQIARYDTKRKILVVAFGGGVIGDLAGLAAALYKRGVPYIQIPTTFLGQIDSSVGGKTAIDLPAGKNLIGTFYQPKLVLIDFALLTSLPKKELIAGMGEAIKYGIIQDAKLFSLIEKNHRQILALKPDIIGAVIERCLRIKARIVEQDEKETKGLRTVLNLGHTIGHAIEAASKFQGLRHGEAVAVGTLVSCHISWQMGLLSLKDFTRIERLIALVGLPRTIQGIRLAKLITMHYRDKKFIGSTNRFVLPVGIGRVIIRKNIPLAVIKKAIADRLA